MVNQQKWSLSAFGFFFFLFYAIPSFAVDVPPLPQNIESAVRHLPIQYNGRVKPFESFSREVLDLITGSQTFGRAAPFETVLHIIAFPEKWEKAPILSIPYRPLREQLGLSSEKTHVSYQGLIATPLMQYLPAIVEKQANDEKLTLLENEILDLHHRFATLHALFSGDLRLVPSENYREAVWLPLTHLSQLKEQDRKAIQRTWQNWLFAYRGGNREEMQATLQAFRETLYALHPSAVPERWRLSLEVRYHQLAPLRLAWILYGIASLFFGMSLAGRLRKLRTLGLLVFFGSLIFHTGGIVMRMILAGRPPVANFYESMLWLAWITVCFGLFFELKDRISYFGLAASVFGGVTLALSEQLPLDPAIQPIVAVLRSNLWLSVHVLTIVGSYGVLTLATGIAHFYAGATLFRKETSLESLGKGLYRVIQIGVILLASGIMLGAVWANASWGRYWGWDPKETWALITLLWFLALLHARKAHWIGMRGLSIGTLLGFFLLLMTYYGVSFYLVGLHSYAGSHAKPIPPLLIAYLVAESLFLLSVFARTRRFAK